MRKPDTIKLLYLDFDGFFASVEQLRDPALRGRPVGIVPYICGKTCIIACSREAKAMGVKNVMGADEAKRICKDVAPMHPKAMPVILHPEDYDRWLTTEVDEACSLITPFPSQLMTIA